MTFEKFKQIVEENRRLGVKPEAEISHVCADTCNMRVEDNVSGIRIEQLVADICENGMGNISNPEALKDWTGWGHDAKTEHTLMTFRYDFGTAEVTMKERQVTKETNKTLLLSDDTAFRKEDLDVVNFSMSPVRGTALTISSTELNESEACHMFAKWFVEKAGLLAERSDSLGGTRNDGGMNGRLQ